MPWSKGEKCSKKVTNLCKNIPRIKKCMSKGNDCENLNKKEPKRNTKKKAYCRNVRCVQSVEECSCPMYHDPVCDKQGNYYDNIECAVCNSGKTVEEFSSCNLGVGVIGTEGPLF